MENTCENMGTVREIGANGGLKDSSDRKILSAEQREEIGRYDKSAEECAAAVGKLRELFETGSVKIGEEFLSLDNIGLCVQYVTAVYARAAVLWGEIRGRANSAEMRRKFKDAVLFGQLKKYAGKKDGGAVRFTQKDIESAAAAKNESLYALEQEWSLLYAKIGACKDVLETYLTSLELIYRAGKTEWRTTK